MNNGENSNSDDRPNQSGGEKRGFSLPSTSSKPPMPPVNPPKKEEK